MSESKLASGDPVISKTALVYGQMNEPPGARARVALSALTVAEYFRDEEKQDVLFFVDNIFRFTQAGSEVSALLGRIPSAVGYQPTLSTEMGALQERITSTNKGSITSVQAIYVPADDLTDPAPGHGIRAHLDATTVLSRALTEIGIYPAVDPARLDQHSPRPQRHRPAALRRRAQGAVHPPEVQGPAGHHRHPGDGRAQREDDKLIVNRAPARSSGSSRSPFSVAAVFTGMEGKQVPLKDTIDGFEEVVQGKLDDLPEQAFYMVGNIAEARAKAQTLSGKS